MRLKSCLKAWRHSWQIPFESWLSSLTRRRKVTKSTGFFLEFGIAVDKELETQVNSGQNVDENLNSRFSPKPGVPEASHCALDTARASVVSEK